MLKVIKLPCTINIPNYLAFCIILRFHFIFPGAFDDEDVIHVDGDVNPVRDLETIGEELRLKDEELLMQNFEKLDRVVNRGNDKKLKPEYVSCCCGTMRSYKR